MALSLPALPKDTPGNHGSLAVDGDSLRRATIWSSALPGGRKELLVEALITHRLAFSFAAELSAPVPGKGTYHLRGSHHRPASLQLQQPEHILPSF